MNINYCIQQLAANADAIEHLLRGIDRVQARWKPSAGEWSVLEVVNHLYDEERRDFRPRIQHLFAAESERWPDINPAQWVIEEGYNERDLVDSLVNFRHERDISLGWLRGLGEVPWEAAYNHPLLDGLTANDLMASWVAHDLLHTRQLVELKYGYYRLQFTPFSPDYAGRW